MAQSLSQEKSLDEEFANRYSDSDNQFNLKLTEEDRIPPVVTDWRGRVEKRSWDRQDDGGSNKRGRWGDRDGNNWDNRRDNNYDRRRDGHSRSYNNYGRHGRYDS